jgi:hypothetical protein
MFILDTSTSVEQEFYAEKNFALDLIKVLPESDFKVIFNNKKLANARIFKIFFIESHTSGYV